MFRLCLFYLPETCLLSPEMPTEQIERILKLQLNNSASCLPSLPIERAQEMAIQSQRLVVDKLKELTAT